MRCFSVENPSLIITRGRSSERKSLKKWLLTVILTFPSLSPFVIHVINVNLLIFRIWL